MPRSVRRRWLAPGAIGLLFVLAMSPVGRPLGTGRGGVQGCVEGDPEISLGEGFCALIVADGIGNARHLTLSKSGAIYVVLGTIRPGTPSLGVVALSDGDGDGRVDTTKRFAALVGSAIEVKEDYVYVSSARGIVRFLLPSDHMVPDGEPEVVVSGFPQAHGAQHPARPFAFDDKGGLYAHVAAPSNTCESVAVSAGPLPDPCPELGWGAGVWRFDANRINQTLMSDGRLMATGIRSSVGMRWDDETRSLWMVNHGRDGLDHRRWPELYSPESDGRLPSDELLMVSDGANFGWPYCYHDRLKFKRLLSPEYGGNGDRVGRCESSVEPSLAFPAHSAPNDLLFYRGTQFPERYRHGVFVAFHGGWTHPEDDQLAYRVVFFPFASGRPTGAWEIFADGFAGSRPVHDPNRAMFRPTGLAEGPDGSLYIADSRKGRIWRVLYRGKN